MYVPWLFLTIRARMFTQFYIFYKRNWTDGFQIETRKFRPSNITMNVIL